MRSKSETIRSVYDYQAKKYCFCLEYEKSHPLSDFFKIFSDTYEPATIGVVRTTGWRQTSRYKRSISSIRSLKSCAAIE